MRVPAHEVELTFDRLRRRHLDDVWEIDRQRPESSWTRRTFADELAGPNRHYVVACQGDQVVAYAGLLVQAGEGHITTMMVEPRLRRRGVATDLLNELVAASRFAKCEAMTLEVRVDNEPAIALYRGFAFEVEGRRPAYYPDGSDAAIMWRRDMDAATPERSSNG